MLTPCSAPVACLLTSSALPASFTLAVPLNQVHMGLVTSRVPFLQSWERLLRPWCSAAETAKVKTCFLCGPNFSFLSHCCGGYSWPCGSADSPKNFGNAHKHPRSTLANCQVAKPQPHSQASPTLGPSVCPSNALFGTFPGFSHSMPVLHFQKE